MALGVLKQGEKTTNGKERKELVHRLCKLREMKSYLDDTKKRGEERGVKDSKSCLHGLRC
jgi:hypothetical protein